MSCGWIKFASPRPVLDKQLVRPSFIDDQDQFQPNQWAGYAANRLESQFGAAT